MIFGILYSTLHGEYGYSWSSLHPCVQGCLETLIKRHELCPNFNSNLETSNRLSLGSDTTGKLVRCEKVQVVGGVDDTAVSVGGACGWA